MQANQIGERCVATSAPETLVNDVGGVVTACVIPNRKLDGFQVRVAHAGYLQSSSGRATALTGTAVDVDGFAATTRAIAEALERYSASRVDPSQLISARAEELGDAAMPLHLLPDPSGGDTDDVGRSFRRTSSADEIRWHRAVCASTWREAWVPAVLAVFGLEPTTYERFGRQTSSSCAVGASAPEAALGAVLESVERDAVTLLWLLAWSPPRLDWSLLRSIDPRIADLEARLRRHGLLLELFDATTDLGIPVVYAYARSSSGQFVSASASTDTATAAFKAMLEAAQLHLALSDAPDPGEDPFSFTRATDFGKYMSRFENRREFRFLHDSTIRAAPRVLLPPHYPTAARLDAVLARLATIGKDVFLVDLTCDELIGAGLWCVRAVIPSLQPLTLSHRARFASSSRVREFARWSGLDCRPRSAPNPFS